MTAPDLVTGSPELGPPALVEIAREIQAADPVRPLGKVSKHQRAVLRLQSELGDLVDRPGRFWNLNIGSLKERKHERVASRALALNR